MESAVDSILSARRCLVFSGAGASADSGVGTFRGSGGAWNGITGALALIWGGTPIGWKLTPGLVWSKFVRDFYGPIEQAVPHDGLKALAELQQRHFGDNMQFITMNVDGLHQAAGSRNVIEVHGSVRRFRCCQCQEPCTPSLPLSPMKQPSCQVPGCGGRVRPDVTLFTEGLPQDQWRKATAAISALSPGDVLLVVGTSSVVYPAASLPAGAAERGATVIEFNLDLPTPLSDIASITVAGKAAATLRQCVDSVLARRERGIN